MTAVPYRMMKAVIVPEDEAFAIARRLTEEGWTVLPEHATLLKEFGVHKVRLVFGSHESKIAPPPKRGSGATVPHGENETLSP